MKKHVEIARSSRVGVRTILAAIWNNFESSWSEVIIVLLGHLTKKVHT